MANELTLQDTKDYLKNAVELETLYKKQCDTVNEFHRALKRNEPQKYIAQRQVYQPNPKEKFPIKTLIIEILFVGVGLFIAMIVIGITSSLFEFPTLLTIIALVIVEGLYIVYVGGLLSMLFEILPISDFVNYFKYKKSITYAKEMNEKASIEASNKQKQYDEQYKKNMAVYNRNVEEYNKMLEPVRATEKMLKDF